MGYCNVCRSTFKVGESEMRNGAVGYIGTTRSKRTSGGANDPQSWADWIDHLLSRCPRHRLKAIPEIVELDYEEKIAGTIHVSIITDEEIDQELAEEEERQETWFPRLG